MYTDLQQVIAPPASSIARSMLLIATITADREMVRVPLGITETDVATKLNRLEQRVREGCIKLNR